MEPVQAMPLGAARDARTKFRDEPIRHGPRISYTCALASRITLRGQTHVVGTCPLPILRAWLMHHAAKHPVYLSEALDILAAGEDVARWQAVDTLLFHGVMLPLHRE